VACYTYGNNGEEMADILLDKVLEQISDKKIRQTLKSDLPQRAVFGSGGLSAFLGTQELPPEAYGVNYSNLSEPYQKAISEVADLDLRKIRSKGGQSALRKALANQNISGSEADDFINSVRESAEVWLDKKTKKILKSSAKGSSPKKLGDIVDMVKTNKQGVPKIKTIGRYLGRAIRGLGTAKAMGTGAVLGALLVKALDSGIEEERPEEIVSPEVEPTQVVVPKKVESLEDIRAKAKELRGRL
jgi:hypothetical protein